MAFSKYLGFLALGILIGVGGVALVTSPVGKPAIVTLLIGAGLVTTGAMVFALVSRVFYARLAGQMNTPENRKLVADLAVASREPDRLKALLEQNGESLTGLLPLGLGFLAAARSLNYTALALGGIVGVGGLLTGYIQLERMQEQSRLMTIQNSLTEASRRSAQIIELASIIESLDRADSNKDLIHARAANLSRSLRPYQFLTVEGELSDFISPERGQLLNMLARADVDLADVIQLGADFSFSDLTDIVLSRKQLCGINLHSANLTGASFNGAQLCDADLSSAALPDARMFNVQSFYGTLEGAKTDDPNWLDKRLVPNYTSGLVSGLSQGSEMTARDDASDHAEPRRKDEYFFSVSRFDKTSANESVFIAKLPLAQLNQWTKYQQRGNELFDLHSVFERDVLPRGHVLELSDYHSREEQMHEIALSLKDTFAQAAAAPASEAKLLPPPSPYAGSKSSEIFQSGKVRLTDSTTISHLPHRTQTFEYYALFGMFPPHGDYRLISPGGVDEPLSIGRPHLDPAQPINLKGANFAFADLRYVTFGATDLTGANLSNAFLPSWSSFEMAKLDDVNWAGAVVGSNGELDEESIKPDWPQAALDAHNLEAVADCTNGEADQGVIYCVYQLYIKDIDPLPADVADVVVPEVIPEKP